jgi:hypothetical protein
MRYVDELNNIIEQLQREIDDCVTQLNNCKEISDKIILADRLNKLCQTIHSLQEQL